MFWYDDDVPVPDTYVAFRGRFSVPADGNIEVRCLGASWYAAWLDGGRLLEGPPRFELTHPEYQCETLRVAAGEHVLSFQVHCAGTATRMLKDIAPFVHCEVWQDNQEIAIQWRAAPLEGYRSQVRRINPQLTWIEWCDTRLDPPHWRETHFDDSSWKTPVRVQRPVGPMRPLSCGNARDFPHSLACVAQGALAEVYGYEFDDVPARFFLRDLAPESTPPQGAWRRYDLGRVQLGRPEFTLDLPEGAVVEIGMNEIMHHGRVSPYVTLAAGPSCNLDHYIAHGGIQTFSPITPKAGRYLEVHVLADPEVIHFAAERFIERGYYAPSEARFLCGDLLLDRIWATGVETFRACAEDALTDNPTRERGQWTGDVVSVGLDIAAASYTDLRLLRRGLVQQAQSARDDGLVAGLGPGHHIYLTTFALQWVSACVNYHDYTGDIGLLEELYSAARRNLDYFRQHETSAGLGDSVGAVFIDWGYVRDEGCVDIANNLHYLSALNAMADWCRRLGHNEEADVYAQHAGKLSKILADPIGALTSDGFEPLGYHSTALGLHHGMIPKDRTAAAVAFIKAHILSCFPNDTEAPRLSAPGQACRRIITPYFAHFAFMPLWEHGEADFVLDQYRRCWGWMLDQGNTTWMEVFDPRWSHCHQWAGCPTWQLSRYALGLRPVFSHGSGTYALTLEPGSLESASGRVPWPGTPHHIDVRWTRDGGVVRYEVTAPDTIRIVDPTTGQELFCGSHGILDLKQ